MKDDALLAQAAFPNWYASVLQWDDGLAARNEIARMAGEAREYGWTVRDGQAHLPDDRRLAFARALGLASGEVSREVDELRGGRR